jgi:hypothetical protein
MFAQVHPMPGDYLNTFCLLDLPTDKNHRDLSLETLQATICDLTVCLQTLNLKHQWNKWQYLL